MNTSLDVLRERLLTTGRRQLAVAAEREMAAGRERALCRRMHFMLPREVARRAKKLCATWCNDAGVLVKEPCCDVPADKAPHIRTASTRYLRG